jgi:L-ascorbate metabolism protein UlaG (beta-lactamase superfamily)
MTDEAKRDRNVYYQGETSDHFNGRRFFNPGGIAPLGFRAFWIWKTKEKPARWPKHFASPHAGAKPDARIGGDGLRVTMIGHASLLIQVAGLNILTDPVWSDRVSPVSFIGPRRHNPPGIAQVDLPPIDIIVVTHNHYDHLDLKTLGALHRAHAPRIVTPLGNDTIIGKVLPQARITVTDWGDRTQLAHDVALHTEPCHHWSARGSRDRRMALWAAFVIETPAGKIYHIGDTGFHHGINYRAAAEKHGGFRLANLPIGAYEPRWFMQAQHQNPQEAVEGMRMANAAHAIGHHWGTFQLTDEAVDAPINALQTALAEKRIDPTLFRALRPGEAFDVPPA